MTSYTIRRTNDELLMRRLHKQIFPDDDWDAPDPDAMWVVRTEEGTAVGFCLARRVRNENAVFLSRVGVLPCALGAGLQRRMIRARLRWAKSIGAEHAITYVLYRNHPSLVNLLRCGFRLYNPTWRYAGDVHYLFKSVSADRAAAPSAQARNAKAPASGS